MFKTLPFVPCDICSKAERPKGIEGYYYTGPEEDIQLKECDCHKKWMEQNMFLIRAGKNNIWTTEKARSYDLFNNHIGEKISNYVKYFIDSEDFREASLYLYGTSRTQKTTIAQWVGLSMALKGYSVYYISMHNFITKLVPSEFKDIDKFKVFHDKMIGMDFLIIDDAFNDKQANIQPFQLPYIESFFRERMEISKKGIIFVSSVHPSKIKDTKFSSSLQDFIEKTLTKFDSLFTMTDAVDMVDTKSIFGGSTND
jgi:hypothetical protein